MIAELRYLWSPDAPDLPGWTPDDEDFAIALRIVAGPAGEPGEESFDLTLCTPGWISRRVQEEGIITGRHLLIVTDYRYDQIYRYIVKYLSTCTGNSWQEVAAKVGRLGSWEFEDYRP